jgi:hypothetical protein
MHAETPRFASKTTIFPKHEVFEVVVIVTPQSTYIQRSHFYGIFTVLIASALKRGIHPPPPGTLNSNMFSGVDGLSLGNLLRTWRTEKIPGTCHYSRRGVAPEIKGLGKQHFE